MRPVLQSLPNSPQQRRCSGADRDRRGGGGGVAQQGGEQRVRVAEAQCEGSHPRRSEADEGAEVHL